ncbi:MAG: hypothetical protein IJ576_08230 [Synergistaceae bacterium]|nr:hypothetical protein [Synergistaceae bacterium]MBR1602898.1 hypothetical protein [Synergistaceae bacterium]
MENSVESMKESSIISVKVNAKLHKACRKKLLDEGRTLADLIRSALNQYLDGTLSITA